VSDRLPEEPPADLKFVAVGDPDAGTAGIVAVDVAEDGPRTRVFVAVRNDSPLAAERVVEATAGPASLRQGISLAPFGARGVVFDVPGALPERIALRLDPADRLGDDAIDLSRAALRVAFDDGPGAPSEAHTDAVARALDAAAPGWRRESASSAVDLFVGPSERARDTAAVLVLHPIPAGAAGVRPTSFRPVDSFLLGRDLDAAGVDLVYAPAVAAAPAAIVRERGRLPREGTDVLDRSFVPPLIVEWLPDPLAGSPAPVEHPIWPLFVENLVVRLQGERAPSADSATSGYRVAHGFLDPSRGDSTRLGRDVVPFDRRWLEGVPIDRRARPRSLRPLLAAGAGVCLLLLWIGPALARRRASP
jgi:hypothetical protein